MIIKENGYLTDIKDIEFNEELINVLRILDQIKSCWNNY